MRNRVLSAIITWLGALASGFVLSLLWVIYMVFVRGFGGWGGRTSRTVDISVGLVLLVLWGLIVLGVAWYLSEAGPGKLGMSLRIAAGTMVGLLAWLLLRPSVFVSLVTPSQFVAPYGKMPVALVTAWLGSGLLGAIIGAGWTTRARTKTG
jgi:hypothetical protein